MPIYEFNCSTCDHSFEELVRSAEAINEVACPQCGSRHVRRKISLFAAKSASGGPGFAAASATSCAAGST
jgi:putative FmdB family regulatory protein